MNIEVGKQYRYVSHKGLRPHPNEYIEDGTIVTVTVVMPGGVMLEGYKYPHKKGRLQELPEAKQSALKLTEALERMSEDHKRVFNADYDGSPLELWGDEDGCYVFALEGLFDAGMQWEFFKLDWVEVTK